MVEIDKIIIVTQQTWLDGLIEKFNTKQQARFYIEHMGGSFENYLTQHTEYYSGLRLLKRFLPSNIRYQQVDRSFLPNFLFGDNDLVIVYGRDGLVINTAKYLDQQSILAVNPNPSINEGVLLPFTIDDVPIIINQILDNTSLRSSITIAEAKLNSGQKLEGVNDIFIGHQSHQSARYTLTIDGYYERQSSSGIIISTGVGSTGWYKSIILGAMAISQNYNHTSRSTLNEMDYRIPWDASYLMYCVREPWPSKQSGNSLVYGKIEQGQSITVESHMPEGGVIFSDGIEKDHLSFNSGSKVEVRLSPKIVSIFQKE